MIIPMFVPMKCHQIPYNPMKSYSLYGGVHVISGFSSSLGTSMTMESSIPRLDGNTGRKSWGPLSVTDVRWHGISLALWEEIWRHGVLLMRKILGFLGKFHGKSVKIQVWNPINLYTLRWFQGKKHVNTTVSRTFSSTNPSRVTLPR